MCICARHEFVLPNAVGDLQCGERYANIDYLYASAARHFSRLLRVMISYDIASQWSKNLRKQLKHLPPLVRLKLVRAIFETMYRFVIPKMHIKGHILLCQLLFLLYLALASGQLDGEGIERLERVPVWKELVARFEAARVAGEPEPLNPYEVKVQGLTEAQVRKQFEEEETKAGAAGKVSISVVSPSGFVAFGLELEEEQRRICISAELKKAQSTAAQYNLESARLKCGKNIDKWRSLQATYTPAALIRVREEEKKDAERARQHSADLAKRREAGEEVEDELEEDRLPEDVPLFLPTALTAEERAAGGGTDLLAIEVPMRRGQCRDALAAMRNQLHIKAQLLLYRLANVRHQAMNTRSRTLVNRNEGKLKGHTDKFQAAWTALALVLPTHKIGFPRLCKSDIRCMDDPESLPAQKARELEKERRWVYEQAKRVAMGDFPLISTEMEEWVEGDGEDDEDTADADGTKKKGEKGRGESKRVMSWIWTDTGVAGTDAEMEDSLRIEWCRAFARVRRWREKVSILEEEWRRLPFSLQHLADDWGQRARAAADKNDETGLADGKVAYAEKQRELFLELIRRAENTHTEVKKRKKRAMAGGAKEDEDHEAESDVGEDVGVEGPQDVDSEDDI
uniref:Uncharacterized protein n=1 Tax=Mycena chlorophos TaxID=658473 RepID=A0ABQ0KUQ3_MYCCL|nr:predicted protein [Mycena chlorophos]